MAIRLANLPQDYAPIAEVLAAESPGWAATAAELAYEDAARDPRYHHAAFVAEASGHGQAPIVGVAFTDLDTLALGQGRYELNLRVHPDWQGHGVGKALYQAAIDHLAALAPREITAMVWEAHPRAARFLADRGFVETWRRIDSRLDVANFDWAPYAGLDDHIRSLGVRLTTYAELEGDPERLRKLYSLDCALWQDIPYGQAIVPRTLEQFAAAEVNHPDYMPDACFIAIKDGQFIGYSNLLEADDGYNTDMTGVLPAYRGQGLATLLKLRGIRYAQERGNRPLYTVNDSVNTAMLSLNHKLGFQPIGANLRFVKVLD
ncbi:MAG TPA: GNAT family N-acetyltransferase [Roseiflexaceae bacterium]|nr:GNAT family N-acetyltransferase [Roseiflexaceae bacterium]